MGTRIVARRYELSDDLRAYIEGKVEKLHKYYPDGILDVEVALTQEKLQSTVEILVDAAGFDVQSTEHAEDIRTAFDLALKKVQYQLKKRKERLWGNKKRRKSPRKAQDMMSESEEPEVSVPIIKSIHPHSLDLSEALKKGLHTKEPLVIKGPTGKDLRVIYKNELGETVVLEVKE